MGGQVYFFLTEADQIVLDTLIGDRFSDAVVLRDRFSTHRIEIEDKRPLASGLYYISFQEFLDGIETEGPNFKGFFEIDLYKSRVIEYLTGGCYIKNRTMRISRGRLFYKSKYYDKNNQIVFKEYDFEKRAKSIFGIFKKNLHYDKVRMAYIGEDALKKEREGWILNPI